MKKIGKQNNGMVQAYRGNYRGKGSTEEQVEMLANMGIDLKKKDYIQKFLDTLSILQSIGVDISKITQEDTIETLAKKSGISRKNLEEIGIDTTKKIGRQRHRIAQIYRGNYRGKGPTEEQVEMLANMGIDLKKRDSIQEFLDTLRILQSIGVDISKLTERDTIETLAKKSGISRKKLEEIGLDSTKKIGKQRDTIVQTCKGNVRGKRPTEEQVKMLESMGIDLKKRDYIHEFLDTLRILQSIGVDISKITKGDTIETLAKRSGISRKKLEEIGIDTTKKIGIQKSNIAQAYRGKKTVKRPTEEQVEMLASIGINLKKRDSIQEFLDTLRILQSIGVDISKLTERDTIETLAKKSGISRKKLEEIGIDTTKKIGMQKNSIASAYRGNVNRKRPTEEQVEKLESMGINLKKRGGTQEFLHKSMDINLKKRDSIQEFLDTLSILQSIKVDISKLTQRDTIETLAKKSGISRKKLEEMGLDSTRKIGIQKCNIALASRGKGTAKRPTEEQVEKLESMGINLKKRDSIQEFLDTLRILQSIGVDISKLTQKDTIETLAKKSGISRKKLEEIGLDSMKKIGMQKNNIALASRGKGTVKRPTEEQVEELLKLGISLEKKSRTSKEIAEASISSLTDIEMSDREDAVLKELVEKTKEGGMNLDEQS